MTDAVPVLATEEACTWREPRLAPAWLLGAGFLPVGAYYITALSTVPILLAARHVAEAQIATVTSVAIAPGFLSFIFLPLLDWKLKRRTYAIGFAVMGAACVFGALVSITNLAVLAACLFMGNMAIGLSSAAVGGWFGNIAPAGEKDALGAWFNVANFGGGGILGSTAIYLLHHLPGLAGPAAIALTVVLVVPLFVWTPCPPADGKLASESFRNFAGDVFALLQRPTVLWVLAIFVAPSASFALTNTLPSLGHEFRTPDEVVGMINGGGVALAGIVGSLLVPPLARLAQPVLLYLGIGVAGAAFTLSLIPAPRDTTVFMIAVVGENVFQAAAYAAVNVIALRAVGHDNPLAATQFGLLTGAAIIPLTYMQMIDGNIYALGGIAGTFIADAAISGTACILLGCLFSRYGRRVVPI